VATGISSAAAIIRRVHRALGRYAAQPELRAGTGPDAAQLAVEAQENLLRHFFGGRAVVQKMPCDAIDHGLMLSHQAGKIAAGLFRVRRQHYFSSA